jgi:tetratricopeptide (TPR) repeat protein
LHSQLEELVDRRDYAGALRLAAREADHAYERQRYADGVRVLRSLVQSLKDHSVAVWDVYIAAYQKVVGLDNQMKDKSATIRDLIELSRYCIRDGDFTKALAAADSAVGLDQDSVDALNQKARVLAYRRDYTQAFHLLDASLGISPQNPRTLYLKASILGNSGKFSEALELYEQVRRLEPAYPGLAKAIAEIRHQIDWRVRAIEGPGGTVARVTQPADIDRIPAIERKGKADEQEQAGRAGLETLYDEAPPAESESEAVAQTEGPAEPQQPSEPEPAGAAGESPATSTRDLIPDMSGELKMNTIVVPRQAWESAEPEPAGPPPAPASEAAGLTVLNQDELAALKRSQQQAQATTAAERPVEAPPTAESGAGQAARGTTGEDLLIGIMRDVRQGTLARDDLMARLSEADSVTIPLPLAVLYFNFLRSPQDGRALADLLAWLARGQYGRLPLAVLEDAVDQGAPVDTGMPEVASILLRADGDKLSPELRRTKADLLLERGDMPAYVREQLAMVRQAAPAASPEGIVHQLDQVLERCVRDESCVRDVLAAASSLGVVDALIDRVNGNADMARQPALESAIVERLGHGAADEAMFVRNEALFQSVTLSDQKVGILRRVLSGALSPDVRRRVLQSLLVLGDLNPAEFAELVGLMAQAHDSTNAPWLIQYLTDHQGELADGRFLLERLSSIAGTDYESRYGLGLAAERMQAWGAAAGYFMQALRARPGDADTIAHVLTATVASGDYDRIADIAEHAGLAPADLEGLVDKAAAEAPELTEGSVERKLVSAWAAFAGARHEEAVAMSSGTVRSGGDARFYVPMALSFERLGLPELAVRELDRGARQTGVSGEIKALLKYHAAVIQLGQGNAAEAAGLLKEVGELVPGFRDTAVLLEQIGAQDAKDVRL